MCGESSAVDASLDANWQQLVRTRHEPSALVVVSGDLGWATGFSPSSGTGLSKIEYQYPVINDLKDPVGDGLELTFNQLVTGLIEAQEAEAEARKDWLDKGLDWYFDTFPSGDPQFDESMRWVIRTYVDFQVEAFINLVDDVKKGWDFTIAVGAAIKDNIVGYYKAGGGGFNGVLLAISGGLGVAGMAESWYGYDIPSGNKLSTGERVFRGVTGGFAAAGVPGMVAKSANLAVKGVSLAGKGLAGARTALGKVYNKIDEMLPCGTPFKRSAGCFVAGTLIHVAEMAPTDALAAVPNGPVESHSRTCVESGLSSEIQGVGSMQPIEIIDLGSRVHGINPQRQDFDFSLPEPDAHSWVTICFTARRSDGSVVDGQLLRPKQWVESHEIIAGAVIPFRLPELQLTGFTLIDCVERCPALAAGSGSVVTGRFVTRIVNSTVRITIEGGETIEGTRSHPVWSLDRQDWVPLGDLRCGEILCGEVEPVRVVASEVVEHLVPVYNLESHGEHVYRVGEKRILVHNATGDYANVVAPKNTRWDYIRERHDKRATDLFGSGKGRNNIGGRNHRWPQL